MRRCSPARRATLPPAVHDVRPEHHFCIVYTSGTTGRPKGVLFDHQAVLQHALVATLEYELDEHSRWLMALPHNSSVQITLLPLLVVGGATGFKDSRGFDAVAFAAEVRAHARDPHLPRPDHAVPGPGGRDHAARTSRR